MDISEHLLGVMKVCLARNCLNMNGFMNHTHGEKDVTRVKLAWLMLAMWFKLLHNNGAHAYWWKIHSMLKLARLAVRHCNDASNSWICIRRNNDWSTSKTWCTPLQRVRQFLCSSLLHENQIHEKKTDASSRKWKRENDSDLYHNILDVSMKIDSREIENVNEKTCTAIKLEYIQLLVLDDTSTNFWNEVATSF